MAGNAPYVNCSEAMNRRQGSKWFGQTAKQGCRLTRNLVKLSSLVLIVSMLHKA